MEQAMFTTATPDEVVDPIAAETVAEAYRRCVAQHADKEGIRTPDGAVSLTWAQLDQRVRALAAGLAGLGLRKGDTIALLLPNTVECHLVDYAAVQLGAVPFTVYGSSSAEQVRHQLANGDTRIVVTDLAGLDRVEEACRELDAVEHRIVVGGQGGTGSLEELEQAGAAADLDAALPVLDPEDLVTLIYTSGTTGPPKAAQWAHRTAMSQLRALAADLPMPELSVVSFLPLAHAGGRITSHYMPLVHGATITVCPDMRKLPEVLPEARPDVLFAVPRLWEKFQVAVETLVEHLPEERRSSARAAMAGEDETGRVLLVPLLRRLGLDRIKVGFVGGAPSAPGLSQFFRDVGVPVLEAYGSTEGSLMIFNRIERFKPGTAGWPLPGVEMRVADDGELLVRGPLNFVDYRNNPEASAETLDAEGWLHTGDIVTVDDEGYVSVVDRKKELIISAAGKNMSPANIEQAIKGESSLIGQVVAIGDGRRYNTALVTLDPEAAPMYAKRLGVEGASVDELVTHPAIREEVQRAIDRGNARLSRVEGVKKFRLLSVAWLPDSDELTPTLKVKRRNIATKYADEIEALYAD